jgi:hypothetical protein
MRKIFLLFTLVPILSFAQNSTNESFVKNDLIIIKGNPSKGFNNSYILFIPKGVEKNKLTRLLVETNNTGKLSDSISLHKRYAISLASESSVGNNISTELKIPLLVPIFPRPASKPLVYTHALDRDVVFEKSKKLKRIDLQLIAMIRDARNQLKDRDVLVYDKVFMNGFSASATFTNRFLFIHPELVAAAAMGGFNGELMLPLKKHQNKEFDYPLGVSDFEKIFDKKFNQQTYQNIPQYMYMGALDDNDAVQFDDAYNEHERSIINSTLGRYVQERYKECQNIYVENNISATFKTYEKVGHWTTSKVNLDVILFFLKELKKNK